jgi:hypothetical protein
VEPQLDIYTYKVSFRKEFNIVLVFCGIDTSKYCGPRSNLDFINFIWERFEIFSFRKYSLVLLPSASLSPVPSFYTDPFFVYLKYYRAESEGWTDATHCNLCVAEYVDLHRPLGDCRHPAECSCNICVRQPPTLFSSAMHVAIRHVINISELF